MCDKMVLQCPQTVVRLMTLKGLCHPPLQRLNHGHWSCWASTPLKGVQGGNRNGALCAQTKQNKTKQNKTKLQKKPSDSWTVTKLHSVSFLFYINLKSGCLSLQTVFFAFAGISKYMQVYPFHKYCCTTSVCRIHFSPNMSKDPNICM